MILIDRRGFIGIPSSHTQREVLGSNTCIYTRARAPIFHVLKKKKMQSDLDYVIREC